jgi:AcrR family transcriptional regulator
MVTKLASEVKPKQPLAKAPGRPRSEAAKHSILLAARTLLAEGGPGAVTMEAIAEHAGVGKPTIYRWWPNRHAVVMEALMDAEPGQAQKAIEQPALNLLGAQLRRIARRFSTPTGRHVTSMIAAADPNSEMAKAFRNHFVMARREEGRALLLLAIAEKNVRPDLKVDIMLDLIYGAIFFRLLMGHAPIDDRFTAALLETVRAGL